LFVLGELQDGPPVVLVLDDAQWADRASLAAITFAVRRLRADRVLALVAARSGAEPSLPLGMRRLADSTRGRRLRLDGLGTEELQALSVATGAGELSARSARRLREHTEGNPLYALAVLRELGPEALAGDRTVAAPPSFSQLLLARLASCPERAVRLVQSAAVLGRRCPLALAARLAGLDDPLGALEDAMAAEVLALEGPDRDVVAFSHPLAHAAVVADLVPTRAQALHARAAGLLDGEAALEHRVAAVAGGDPALAQELRTQAEDEAQRGAWGVAARHLLMAARLDPSRGVRERCLLQAAMLMLAGQDVAGVEALQGEITRLAPSPARDYVRGQLALNLGRWAEAEARLREALGGCEDDCDNEVAAASAAGLAHCSIVNSGRGVEAADLARTALRLASSTSPTRGPARMALMGGLGIAGRAREALATALAEQRTPRSEAEHVGELGGTGTLRLWTDDLHGARRDLAVVVAFAGRHGPITSTFPALANLAEAELRAGAWDDAVAHADRLVSLADDVDARYAAPYGHSTATAIHGFRGDWALAASHATLASSTAEACGDTATLAFASRASACVAYARGDPSGVLAAVEPLLEIGECDGAYEPGVVPWRDLHAEALIRLGRLDEAEAVLVALEARSAQRELASGLAAACRVRGCLESARGDPAAASTAFETGVQHASGLGMPFLQACLALEFGAFLRRCGERRAAAARLEQAGGVFGMLRAAPFLDRCERELRACGRHPARRGTSHLSLTPQERAVARLVAVGLSNREVAAELVLSVKTIEFHLSNVYAKLGVSSRTQLSATLGRGGDGLDPLGSGVASPNRPDTWVH
jgi:DNA-binding CsgD family transcriptional regulator/tetratricopeptide (TPR) repeat protein